MRSDLTRCIQAALEAIFRCHIASGFVITRIALVMEQLDIERYTAVHVALYAQFDLADIASAIHGRTDVVYAHAVTLVGMQPIGFDVRCDDGGQASRNMCGNTHPERCLHA